MVEEVEVGRENDETSVDETVGTRRIRLDLERRLVEAGGVGDGGVGTVGGDPVRARTRGGEKRELQLDRRRKKEKRKEEGRRTSPQGNETAS